MTIILTYDDFCELWEEASEPDDSPYEADDFDWIERFPTRLGEGLNDYKLKLGFRQVFGSDLA